MLRKMTAMHGWTISGRDDDIGKVHDFYFDDDSWRVRYLIADTGPWIFGRKILLAPEAITEFQWEPGRLVSDLTQRQVKESPDVNVELPVSRQHEISLHNHYAWTYYWMSPMGGMPGAATTTPTASFSGAMAPDVPVASPVKEEVEEAVEQAQNPHLRSVREVSGYQIEATDGAIGQIADFFVDEEDWRIRYVLVDTGNWLSDRQVLISPDWLTDIQWPERTAQVHVTREMVEQSPEYDPVAPVQRTDEARIYRHYGIPAYWL